MIKGFDVIPCDLPIGYYPNDEIEKLYIKKRERAFFYSLLLFIEQSIFHTKSGGLCFFLIPNHLFVSEDSDKLHAFLKEHVFIQGLIQLPLTLFKNEEAARKVSLSSKRKKKDKHLQKMFTRKCPDLKESKSK